MAVKEFEAAIGGRLLVDIPHENKRLLVRIEVDGVAITNDKCEHRGGPLHLAYQDAEKYWRCPWHDRRAKKAETVDDVCAIFYSGRRLLRLASAHSESVLWPVRTISI
ncbi:Rieske 2Fe-2S domain-containing protein [Methylosinus sporium]|uniref:Rieske 2Fe-2S domain-containing protein n=1 Tax=Methylosinus sporium TaxID=428 RepID=UPI00132FEDE8|nr:Rieske 2Fe-2S domain-containing protein [Methylosinus sporium]